MTSDETRVHTVALIDCRDVFDDVLGAGGEVTFSPKGASMLPLFRTAGDTVTLVKPPERIKLGTVALYAMPDGRCVLHRLVRRRGKRLIFCGDNRLEWDEPVWTENVIGVMASCRSRGKSRSAGDLFCRAYGAWMVVTAGVKRPALCVGRFIYGAWKRLFRQERRK